MTKKKTIEEHSPKPSYECRVCGDAARGLNFNIMTCMPCKTFFRKNAFKRSTLICEFTNTCSITKITRSYCSPCRLQKCFELGMDPKLIRSIPQVKLSSKKLQKVSEIKDQQIALPMPAPLGLLRNDRSTLTTNEWTLLSNFLHAYDDQNICLRIQHFLDYASSLPPKFRWKSLDAYNVVGQFFTAVQPLIARVPELNFLPIDARRVITQHNLNTIGAANGILICRELDIYKNPCFWNPCIIGYGPEFMAECVGNSARCDPNSNLIKVMLFVASFSSNCSVVTYNSDENLTTITSSMELVRIQNVYVTMLWKYLLYLYGFKEAVIRYSYLIKNILDVTRMVSLMPKNETHDLMVEAIATETERALIVKD